jgi:methionyl-tRNA formyltransferase
MWQAYTPWPGIYTMYEEKRLLIEKCSTLPLLGGVRGGTPPNLPYEGRSGTTGQVIKLTDGEIGVVCGE